MSLTPTETALRTSPLRLGTLLALTLGGILLAIWLWSRVCAFPAQPWNDLRVATTVALTQGWSVYPTAESGTINTWTYGPLPLLFFWPASAAATAGGAMLVSAVLNLLLTLAPLALVCFGWPAWDRAADTQAARWLAFLLCIALWPERHYALHSADNLAIACGLVGNLLLVRARTAREFWLAAILATGAIACKQTAAGIPLAQALWIGVTAGWRAGLVHAGRCLVSGAILGGLCVAVFGGAGLWFVLVELPLHFKWAPDPLERLGSVAPELALHLLLPLGVIVLAPRAGARPALRLSALAWACALPLGLSALMKFGGRMNSIYAFLLWLPPVATMLFTAQPSSLRTRRLPLAAALLVATIACSRLTHAGPLVLVPQLHDYHEAALVAARLPGQVWFPLHPLVTLYSDHRYYHDEDGLYVRRMTHKVVSPEHAAAQLPAGLRAMAFHKGWTDWHIARRIMPPDARETSFGAWSILAVGPPPAPVP